MTEVRNVLWPDYETPEYSAARNFCGIAGTLELFHRSALSFQQIVGEATGHPVAVFPSALTRLATGCPSTNGFWPTSTLRRCSASTICLPSRWPRRRVAAHASRSSPENACCCCAAP